MFLPFKNQKLVYDLFDREIQSIRRTGDGKFVYHLKRTSTVVNNTGTLLTMNPTYEINKEPEISFNRGCTYTPRIVPIRTHNGYVLQIII